MQDIAESELVETLSGATIASTRAVVTPLPRNVEVHRDRVGGNPGDRNVGNAIPVEVIHRRLHRLCVGWEDALNVEAAVAAAAQDAHRRERIERRSIVVIGDDEIEDAIAIDVTRDNLL